MPVVKECVREVVTLIEGKKLHSSLYECVNRANSWSERMKLNGFLLLNIVKSAKF